MQVSLLAVTLILFKSFQGLHAQGSDSINLTDKNNLKQGHWIVYGESKPNTCYKSDQKVQEGYYLDNKKTGLWTEYFCNDKIKSKIEFKAGKPNGKAVTFHEDGTVSETGTFVINKWVGEYILYRKKDVPQQMLMFNENGKREGLQKDYFPNGNLQVISYQTTGMSGSFIEFDSLGMVKTMGVNERIVKEGDTLSADDKKALDYLMHIASKENKLVKPSKKTPSKKKESTKEPIQDINMNPAEIQQRN